ncbi:porin family protein [Flammeovirga sp. OC4]|uniref:porin family protein n=1 Tax=Flammeovirga sp. OC4 TaxID=1382345 RepID=UPI0005C56435|nr:porin family protein [Flammeovirga sp. OC4]
MKALKTLLLITILYCTQANLFAQSQDTQGGFKAGFNSSTIGGDSEGVKSKLGFHIGAFLKLRASNYVYIQPEAIFSMQGANASEGDMKINYNYVNFPLLVKIYPTGEKLSLLVGPQIGFLVSAKAKINGEKVDLSNELKRSDYALAFGVGYDFNRIYLDLRYNAGLSNTPRNSDEGSFPNNVIQLGVGIFL